MELSGGSRDGKNNVTCWLGLSRMLMLMLLCKGREGSEVADSLTTMLSDGLSG